MKANSTLVKFLLRILVKAQGLSAIVPPGAFFCDRDCKGLAVHEWRFCRCRKGDVVYKVERSLQAEG